MTASLIWPAARFTGVARGFSRAFAGLKGLRHDRGVTMAVAILTFGVCLLMSGTAFARTLASRPLSSDPYGLF